MIDRLTRTIVRVVLLLVVSLCAACASGSKENLSEAQHSGVAVEESETVASIPPGAEPEEVIEPDSARSAYLASPPTQYFCVSADSACFYKYPDTGASIKLYLFPGEAVWVKDLNLSDGYYYYVIPEPDKLYKAWILRDGKEMSGYLPGKFIGKALCSGAWDGGKEILSFRYTRTSKSSEFDNDAELVLIKRGRITDHLTVPDAYSGNEIMDMGSKGIIGDIATYKLAYGTEGCDYTQGEFIFGVRDTSLVLVADESYSYSAGIYHTSNEFIFPSDSGGVRDQLAVICHVENYEDSVLY